MKKTLSFTMALVMLLSTAMIPTLADEFGIYEAPDPDAIAQSEDPDMLSDDGGGGDLGKFQN